MKDADIWFPAKKYGFGWGFPVTWQGWLVLVIYLAGLVTLAHFAAPDEHPYLFSASVLILSALLIRVCYLKGERPRWRWGK